MTADHPSFLMWLDPGKTTGLAWYDIEADQFFSGQYDEHDLIGVVELLADIYGHRMAVGWELYIQTPRSKGTAKYSLGEIAKVKAACEERGIEILKGQPSSARNLQSTVIFLRRLGWYAAGKRHANDAACHLFRYLIKQHPIPQNICKRLPAGY
jgi:hypothetical protein